MNEKPRAAFAFALSGRYGGGHCVLMGESEQ